MSDLLKKHRIIGIKHTLRQLKEAGLVEEDSNYPEEAVADVQSEVLSTARRWYKVGAKRGALEIIEALLNGDLVVIANADGTLKEIQANTMSICWSRVLKVKVGSETQEPKKQDYQLTVKELGFK